MLSRELRGRADFVIFAILMEIPFNEDTEYEAWISRRYSM